MQCQADEANGKIPEARSWLHPQICQQTEAENQHRHREPQLNVSQNGSRFGPVHRDLTAHYYTTDWRHGFVMETQSI
jgi:hypothetical protein